MKPTLEIVRKFKHLLSFGLTQGLGYAKEGKTCIEGAIALAYGMNLTDHPNCVHKDIADIKIWINDNSWWKDNQERAKLMLKVGIAQMGSIEIGDKFKALFTNKEKESIIPLTFDLIPIKSKIPEHEELKQYWIENWKDRNKILEKFKNYYYNYSYYYSYYHSYYYSYSYSYYYSFYKEFISSTLIRDTYLKILLETLIELKSPGCEFLYLADE